MKIGIDVDEVIAEFMDSFLKFYNHKHKTHFRREDFKSYNLWETLGVSKDQTTLAANEFYDTDYFRNITPVHGSIYGVYSLNKKMGNEVVIITARPPEIENSTISWIKEYFPILSDIYFVHNSAISGDARASTKGDICSRLGIDILIEDNLTFVNEVRQLSEKTKVLVYECPWNKGKELPQGAQFVKSWEDIRNYFDRMKF